MSDFRIFAPKKIIDIPRVSSYSIKRNPRFRGYNVEFSWNYPNDVGILGFIIYKAKYDETFLRREYKIGQSALERLSGKNPIKTNNLLLFDKNVFAFNKKVKNQSNISRHTVEEKKQKKLVYNKVGFQLLNKNKEYKFVDKNIKFGKTYSYVISALTDSLFESEKSVPITAKIEDLTRNAGPDKLEILSDDNSINLYIFDRNENVDEFIIYRREKGDKQFEILDEIDKTDDITIYLDMEILPNIVYEYKVFSKDHYGFLSHNSVYNKSYFTGKISPRGDVEFPLFQIKNSGSRVVIFGQQNDKKVFGYRIERQDPFSVNSNFEIKSNLGLQWPAVHVFEKGKFEFADLSVKKNEGYRYRITSVFKNGKESSKVVTPYLKVDKDLNFDSHQYLFLNKHEKSAPKIVSFFVDVVDKKHDPLVCKFEWNIDGFWDYGKIRINENEYILKIDPLVNNLYFSKLKKGSNYNIILELYDFDGTSLIKSDKVRLAT